MTPLKTNFPSVDGGRAGGGRSSTDPAAGKITVVRKREGVGICSFARITNLLVFIMLFKLHASVLKV